MQHKSINDDTVIKDKCFVTAIELNAVTKL
jgi:hypothetical protein